MIQVRRNVFETNSSSTHSLAVPQDYNTWNIKKRKITFHLGSFGRPCKPKKASPADYLYTAIMFELKWLGWDNNQDKEINEKLRHQKEAPDWTVYNPKVVERLNKLKAILDKYKIKYEFEMPVWDLEYDWTSEKIYAFMRDEKYKKVDRYGYVDRSFDIDHWGELEPILDMLLANGEECIKFLLAGKVFVGSDEADDIERAQIHWNKPTYDEAYWVDLVTGEEVEWSYDHPHKLDLRFRTLPNPYCMEGYNFYLKGN